jgi:hypothetical protein
MGMEYTPASRFAARANFFHETQFSLLTWFAVAANVHLPTTEIDMTANENTARYIDTAETAKMIRAALKRAFPGVKFGVRSHRYAGGSSINIDWLDGPTQAMVAALVGQYQGKGFDGMIDMAYYVEHWLLPDGSVVAAKSSGTEGSRGMVEAFSTERPEGAELVQFGTRHVFTSRKMSIAFARQAYTRLQRKLNEQDLAGSEVLECVDGTAHIIGFPDFYAEQRARREISRLMIARAA